jgi:cobalt-zinc-cadmium efflux system membrane fusion protein
MKTLLSALALALLLASTARAQSTDTAAAAPVILDATAVENLRIKTALVEETDFEEAVFALGRIEARPGNVAAVSSRIAGRVVALNALPGDWLEAGAEVAKVESRQPGSPPPVLSLKAPLGGTVTRLDVRLGDPVEPDKALLEITDLGEVYAIARVPEHVAGRIQSGVTARIAVSASSEEKREGTLLRFGTAADPVSGTIDAIFPLPNPDNQLRPGMRAEFSIVVSRRANVLSVPRAALQGEPSKRFVYVKDFNLPNAFIKAPVVVGQSNDRLVEIISGVLPADEVVTQGAYSLAFVGGGSVSLKEALDAAHGHEHAADGSELTAPPKNKSGVSPGGEDRGHAHKDGNGGHGEAGSPFWMIVSGVLFLALLVVSFWRKRGANRTS